MEIQRKRACRNIQFDDCTWGMIGDSNYQNFLKQTNTKVEDVAAEYLRLNNLALEDRPEGLTITTHVCRGNYHSTWANSQQASLSERSVSPKAGDAAFSLAYLLEHGIMEQRSVIP